MYASSLKGVDMDMSGFDAWVRTEPGYIRRKGLAGSSWRGLVDAKSPTATFHVTIEESRDGVTWTDPPVSHRADAKEDA
jgi:hypothetical protein